MHSTVLAVGCRRLVLAHNGMAWHQFMARKRIAAAAKAEEEERQRRIEETHWVAEAATNAASDSAPRCVFVVPATCQHAELR